MIKSKVIVITEADDPGDAVSEFKSQTEGFGFLKNTVGIAAVNAEFIASGVYRAVAEAAPFPIAGMTTAAQSANGKVGLYLFSITVLTSDDCSFYCGATGEFPETESPRKVIRESYLSMRENFGRGAFGEPPKLVFTFSPFTSHGSHDLVNIISDADPGAAMFGAVAGGAASDASAVEYNTLLGGNVYTRSAVLVLAAGNISPKFFVCSFTKEAVIRPNIGVITKAEGNLLLEVDGIPAADFFEKIGLGVGEMVKKGVFSSTIILDVKESDKSTSVISRTPVSMEGEAVRFAAAVIEGAMMSLAFSTVEVVMQTANELIDKICSCEDEHAAIIYSCAGRQTGLIPRLMQELELVSSRLPGRFSHVACYGYGEICPASAAAGKANNHEHNSTIIACVI